MAGVKGWVSVLLSFTVVSTNSSFASPYFDKAPGQFCMTNWSLEEQEKVLSRIVNLGASFGHGCTTCDVQPTMAQALKDSNDFGWVKRNFLIHYINDMNWQDPDLFAHDFLSIVENDFSADFTSLFDDDTLKESPYRSRWMYDASSMNLKPMSIETEREIIVAPHFRDEAELIGGAKVYEKHRGKKKPDEKRLGVLFQTYASKGEDFSSRSIFDMGRDGERNLSIFKSLGSDQDYQALLRNEWRSKTDRENLISKVVETIYKVNPSLIILSDTLFWDSIPWLLHYANQKAPKSFIMKLLTSPTFTDRIAWTKRYPIEQDQRMMSDFYEVLSRISRGENGHPPVPILFARLMDNPGRMIVEHKMQEGFAKVVGEFFRLHFGVNIEDELLHHLNRLSYKDFSIFSQRDIAATVDDLELIERFENYLTGHQKSNSMSILGWDTALLKEVLVRALEDLPLLLKAADEAFSHVNKYARDIAKRTDNNIHLLNLDAFYHKLPEYLHPGTLHPTIHGSKKMAEFFNKATCSQTPNPR